MTVLIKATHPYRGDLTAWLTSPAGTTSRLFVSNNTDNVANLSWTFTDNAFWGENPRGVWTLRVADVSANDVGTLNSYTPTARMGALVPGLTVTVPDAAAAPGSTIALTAGITRTADGSPWQPAAAVRFLVNGAAVGSAQADAAGTAALSWTMPAGTALGESVIRAELSAEGAWMPAHGAGILTVTAAGSSIAVAPDTKPVGGTATLTAVLSALNGAKLVGKTITFTVDGAAAGAATTQSTGTATANWPVPDTLSIGPHTILASFAGDADNAGSSGAGTLTVTRASTTLTCASAAGVPGGAVTLSAALRTAAGPVAGRTVTFRVAGTAAGSAGTSAAGIASVSWTIPGALGLGAKTIEATFAGDAPYAASAGSGTLTVTTSLHPADVNDDAALTIGEAIAYGSAWKRGAAWPRDPATIPVDYATNAAALWKQGEVYHYDPTQAAPLCWITGAGRAARGAPGGGAARATISPARFRAGDLVRVTIAAEPRVGASAWALEERLPAGWRLVSASGDAGAGVPGVVRWGPFTDGQARTLTYLLRAPRSAGAASLSGALSVDGRSADVTGARTLAPQKGSR